jgi:hypothetical protein
MLLLTDGTLLVHNAYQAEWMRFIPDPKQGYAGGSWGTVSTMALPRGFFASGVLRNGQVFVCGGETSTLTTSDISSGGYSIPPAMHGRKWPSPTPLWPTSRAMFRPPCWRAAGW